MSHYLEVPPFAIYIRRGGLLHMLRIAEMDSDRVVELPLEEGEIRDLIELLQEYIAALDADREKKEIQRRLDDRGIADIRDWWMK